MDPFAMTMRIHRAAVALAVAVVLLSAIALVAIGFVTASSAPSESCWISMLVPDGRPDPSRTCSEGFRTFTDTQAAMEKLMVPVAGVAPWLIGLMLGVSVVGRELEVGTAGLAWSLSGRRLRWLAMRFAPIVALVLLLLFGLSLVSGAVWDVVNPGTPLDPGRLPSLMTLGLAGPTLLAGGLAALGLGLLLGTVMGRTMAAVAVGAVMSLGLALALGPGLQRVVANEVAIWQPRDYGVAPAPSLIDLESGYREGRGPILSYRQAEDLARERCPTCLNDDIDWVSENLQPWRRSAPLETFPAFEAAHTAMGGSIGLLCILITLPLVVRRRPRP